MKVLCKLTKLLTKTCYTICTCTFWCFLGLLYMTIRLLLCMKLLLQVIASTVNVRTYIHVRVHTCILQVVIMYIHIYTYIYTHVHTCTYTYIYVHVHYTYVFANIFDE